MNVIKRNSNLNFPSIIDELFKPDWLGGVENFGGNLPAVNLKETDTDYAIELAAPGKKKEDFKVGMIVEYFNNNQWNEKLVENPNEEWNNMYKLMLKYNKLRIQSRN